jgi:hypothetical protein
MCKSLQKEQKPTPYELVDKICDETMLFPIHSTCCFSFGFAPIVLPYSLSGLLLFHIFNSYQTRSPGRSRRGAERHERRTGCRRRRRCRQKNLA